MLAALLLAQERVLSDAQLGEVLWGKYPPRTYQAQLYTYASRLRQRLPGNLKIVRQAPGYLLRIASARFDYDEFKQLSRAGQAALREQRFLQAAHSLRAALDLWRGPTLADVTDLLAEIERPRIDDARMEALEGRIDAELALGHHSHLTSELVGLVKAYPLRERMRAQLMLALYRSDRQAEAFATYYEGRHLLAEELGVDPGPALRHAFQAIVTDDAGTGRPPDLGVIGELSAATLATVGR